MLRSSGPYLSHGLGVGSDPSDLSDPTPNPQPPPYGFVHRIASATTMRVLVGSPVSSVSRTVNVPGRNGKTPSVTHCEVANCWLIVTTLRPTTPIFVIS